MIRSLWIAKTGLDAQQTQLDVISNNLANVGTAGFKRSLTVLDTMGDAPQPLISVSGDWYQMLTILAVLSLAVGNIVAIAQTNLKRMLAYSTISQVGFVLLGMIGAHTGGDPMQSADAFGSGPRPCSRRWARTN